MKLEKRSEGAPDAQPAEEPAADQKKPVIVYIMILFIVAFLLMALSSFMHQRSNEEVIGNLQSSVTTLQEMQAVQDKNIQLQESLQTAQDKIDSLNKAASGYTDNISLLQNQLAAMESLYTLQQEYSNGEFDACKKTIQSMEDNKQGDLLSTQAMNGETSPAQRYQQLKEAVMSH